MADIHLHTPGGETIVQTEERVAELLQSGDLAPETLFWRSGMADWEPIANFTSAGAVVPATQRLPDLQPQPSGEHAAEAADEAARARVSPTKPLPDLTKPRPAPEESDFVHVTGRRRFSFRRDPEPLTTILQVILVIGICVAALELANAVVRYSSLATETPAVLDADGNPVPPPSPDNSSSPATDQISSVSTDGSGALLSPEPDGGDDLGQMLQWTGWGANALLVVVYFMWLYRTDQNCRHLSAIMRFTPSWAVWCYFVPPLNLFQPLLVMQEIWRVSRNPRTWHNDRQSILVVVWWVLTLGTIGLALYLRLHPVDAQSHAAQANAARLFVLLKVVQVSWYGVFLTMVTVIIHRQHLLVREARRRGEPED
jgi:hypothetical protein